MDDIALEFESASNASEENPENGAFDFEIFCDNIKRCISENLSHESDIKLGYYLVAYEQLYKFFCLLGGAFQFVAVDVRNKIKILQEYRNGEEDKSKNFTTVVGMVKYEKENNYINNPKYVSGSRTLLRLHRGLDFIRKFLNEIYHLEDSIKLGSCAREIYDKTLAEYHTWVVRSTARVAMQFLPTRKELLNKISQNNTEKLNQILKIYPEALEALNITYEKVQNIYSENKILDLP